MVGLEEDVESRQFQASQQLHFQFSFGLKEQPNRKPFSFCQTSSLKQFTREGINVVKIICDFCGKDLKLQNLNIKNRQRIDNIITRYWMYYGP